MIRALAVIGAVAGCADDGGPRLDAVTPSAAPIGAMVMLAGERLCGEPASCETAAGAVQVGLELPTIKATVIAYAESTATIVVPDLAAIGPTVLVVTVNERSSNALDFEVLP